MKHYKTATDDIYSYEDDIDAGLLAKKVVILGLTAITQDEFNTILTSLPYAPDLLSAKDKKKAEMTSKFDEVSIEHVSVNDIIYNGGFDAALKLDGAKRLVELAGLTEVTFYGIDNKPKVLSIAEANTVILTISAKYQTDFAHLQELKVLIDSKQKVSTVEAVNW